MYYKEWITPAQTGRLNTRSARMAARDLQPQAKHPRSAPATIESNDDITSADHMASTAGQRMRGLQEAPTATGITGEQLAPPNVCPIKYNERRQRLHDAKGTPAHASLAQEYYSLLANA